MQPVGVMHNGILIVGDLLSEKCHSSRRSANNVKLMAVDKELLFIKTVVSNLG